MEMYETIGDATIEIRALISRPEPGLPAEAVKAINDIDKGNEKLRLICTFVEMVYGLAETASEDAKEVAAKAALFCESWSFFGLGDEGRGTKIAATLTSRAVSNAPAPWPNWLPKPAWVDVGDAPNTAPTVSPSSAEAAFLATPEGAAAFAAWQTANAGTDAGEPSAPAEA